MSAGYIVNGQCVDVAASYDLFFSFSRPDSFQVLNASGGVDVYQLVYGKELAGWIVYQFKNSTFIGYQSAVAPTFASCDTDTYSSPSSGLPADFDYTALAAVWVFAMSVVVASYVIAKGMGTLIAMFKS